MQELGQASLETGEARVEAGVLGGVEACWRIRWIEWEVSSRLPEKLAEEGHYIALLDWVVWCCGEE